MEATTAETDSYQKAKGDYVTRLSLKANDDRSGFTIYFAKPEHALLTMFHPSAQNWLTIKNADPDVTFDIHLDTFYLRRTITIKKQVTTSQFNRLILAGSDFPSLEAAAKADCSTLGYDAIAVTYPVHFNLQFLRDGGVLPANFEDLDGVIYGTMICQPEKVLVHVESFKVDVQEFLYAVKLALKLEMKLWAHREEYESQKGSIVTYRLVGDLNELNLQRKFIHRTFISPKEIIPQRRYAEIPPIPIVNPFTDLQYPIPREVIRLIATNLSLEDIQKNCLASKAFNSAICDDDNFWREKFRTDYPQREAMKKLGMSWKLFYQATVGRDGLLGITQGYETLQLIGVLGFLSNVVLMPPERKPINLLAGYYDGMRAHISGLGQVFPLFHAISAGVIWSRATGEELSKFLVRDGPPDLAHRHFKPDEPDKYQPLTELGEVLDFRKFLVKAYVHKFMEELGKYPWILNLPKDYVDDYLEAFLLSPGDDFTVQLRVMKDYKGDNLRWGEVLRNRNERGLILSVKDGDEIAGNNPLFRDYNESGAVYDDWSVGIIVELIRKKLGFTHR
jgi:hypothetical protein